METGIGGVTANWLILPKSQKDMLGEIRHWENITFTEWNDKLCVKGFSEPQFKNNVLKKIPKAVLYRQKGGLLFKLNSLVPALRIPKQLHWQEAKYFLRLSPIEFNNNYFGVHENINIILKKSNKEQETYALLIDFKDLFLYSKSAPNQRLNRLKWTLIEEKAFILGEPALPINGEPFWKKGRHIIPMGYELELSALSNKIEETLLAEVKGWILWHNDHSYSIVDQNDLVELNRGSVNLSKQI